MNHKLNLYHNQIRHRLSLSCNLTVNLLQPPSTSQDPSTSTRQQTQRRQPHRDNNRHIFQHHHPTKDRSNSNHKQKQRRRHHGDISRHAFQQRNTTARTAATVITSETSVTASDAVSRGRTPQGTSATVNTTTHSNKSPERDEVESHEQPKRVNLPSGHISLTATGPGSGLEL